MNLTSQSSTPKHAICAPRRSGLSRLQLALMGKGVVQGYRPFTASEADDWADRRGFRGKKVAA